MAKVEITKSELVWPGKYNDDGTLKEVPRVSLPFQIIETVKESRAAREAKKGSVQSTLFDIYEGKEGDTFEAGWRNKLIWGDNLLVMGALLEKFAGKINLIYIDPPFATGADFSFTTEIGENGDEITKDQSVIEEKAYRDTWGEGLSSYVSMMYERLTLVRSLLTEEGTLFVHCDWRVNSHLRLILDEIFGSRCLLNEIVWKRRTGGANTTGAGRMGTITDTILLYSASHQRELRQLRSRLGVTDQEVLEIFNKIDASGRRYRLNNMTSPNPRPNLMYGYKGRPSPKNGWAIGKEKMEEWDRLGKLYFPPNSKLIYRKEYRDEWDGALVQNLWADIPFEKEIIYATQKPELLLDRILQLSSEPNDLVADFFCGSGTTLAVAEKLGRRWIGCDLGRWGIHVTRKRLLGIEKCRPFEVLNLGKYERQYWQGVTFGEKKDKPITEQALYEYLAFILKLYGAQPLPGLAHLHGKKAKAMVHIGAVDAPVTIAEIDAAVDECAKLKQGELHVLGWEWEMGLYDLMVEAAKKKGVRLLLLQIPREVMEQQAAAKGDVRFFELAYLEAEIKQPRKITAQVALKDFVIPNTELIPEDVRSKVKKWSDYIDYWAVDWDFRNDTFMQGWVAYRTRKDRKIQLVSDPHTYENPGKYRLLVKVIDVFGNDTSQIFDVEVK